MLVEKYRPNTLDSILGNKKIIKFLKGFVEAGDMPNLAFTGKSGTGKTAAAWALSYELGCSPGSPAFLELNASDDRGISVVREKIKNFAKTRAITPHGWKVCLLDEADQLTKPAQQALRRVMERYFKSVRFIITANEKGKLSQAIKSRCPPYQFRGLHPSHMRTLLIRVEKGEGRMMSSGVNDAIIKAVHGDARMALNILEGLMTLDDPQPEDIDEVFGLADEASVWGIMHGALKGNIKVLNKASKLVKSGVSAAEVINTMYFTAMRGTAPGMTEEKQLQILSSMGFIPGSSDEMRLTSILGRIILEVRSHSNP